MLAKYFIAAAGLALTGPLVAKSNDVDQPDQVVVTYYDLDLTKQKDIGTLNGRIKRAAVRVCPDREGTKELWRFKVSKKCASEATARTDQRVAEVIRAAKDRKERRALAAR